VTNPYDASSGRPDPPGQVRGWPVAIGILLGLVATFVWMFVVFVVALSMENSPDSLPDWVIFGLFILPLPTAILLLCFRRTRQAAAGFVMGLAIGTLAVAGICSSFIVPGLVA
jgi:hypothetical protein